MPNIKTAYYPIRKNTNFNDWIDYVFKKSKELKGVIQKPELKKLYSILIIIINISF